MNLQELISKLKIITTGTAGGLRFTRKTKGLNLRLFGKNKELEG